MADIEQQKEVVSASDVDIEKADSKEATDMVVVPIENAEQADKIEQVAKMKSEKKIDSKNPKPSPEGDTASMTLGGKWGHIFRRVWHIGLFTSVPYLYYFIFHDLVNDWNGSHRQLRMFIAFLAFLMMILEAIRIKFGILMFGLRSYERYQISAQAWGMVGAILVLLAAPQRNAGSSTQSNSDRALLGMPITWSLGLLDPLIGELKGHGVFGRFVRNGEGFNAKERTAIGTLAAYIIWIGIGFVIDQTSVWWFWIIAAPLCILAEYPSLRIIDDNGMMALVPLAFTLLFQPFLFEE